ncbi:phage tail protein [Methylomonas sp. SURF-1]|uniref:Phage tail protein n=1 Tax=Methylomonas aurea TaxID=2952224 RepID=A0ABT1UGJ1_9GAMM|nr:phage tail protein [Methylomonas sp. SURF-1]MCQ8180963.1 phage tail protein [Methylomonas sp. SURF-1]
MKRQAIERLLPGIFQRGLTPQTPLFAILEIMEALHAPAEAILENVETRFNPYLADERFVPMLAAWVDLDRLSPLSGAGRANGAPPISTGIERLRELIASATLLSKWRGTAYGLKLFLQTATGDAGFELRENATADGAARPFHLCVLAPERLRPHRGLIERIVDQEKPAYATSEVCFVADGGT